MESLHFVFINGRGASGKDTQAELIVANNPSSVRISAGDIIRGARTPDGPFGQFYPIVSPFIELVDKGGLFPETIVPILVDQVVQDHEKQDKDIFVFTGYPRTTNQLVSVDDYIKQLKADGKQVRTDFLCYSILENHARGRARFRRESAYKLGTDPRADDEEKVVENRLITYRDNTQPMLKQLAREHRLKVIKSSGSIENVFARTKLVLGL